jgi:glucosyl-dolichyl phosphate glucuronosyltransferase
MRSGGVSVLKLKTMKTATIIICTCNRAEHLRETLKSVERLKAPSFLSVNLIIVDNGSVDHTREVVQGYASELIPVSYLYEPRRGKGHACNRAISVSQGDLLLWTDDDVRLPPNWILQMTAPLLDGQADGVSGRVRMAAYLERKWMRRTHFFRLADNRFRSKDDLTMVGANMAFLRSVLHKVPHFETELGPGGSGQRDDTLFSHQMLRAGFRILQSECEVEHHFEENRLLRRAWLGHGEASGRSSAMLCFHWEHQDVRWPVFFRILWGMALTLHRISHPLAKMEQEGCGRVEIRMVEQVAFYKAYLQYKNGTRKYARYGLAPIPPERGTGTVAEPGGACALSGT